MNTTPANARNPWATGAMLIARGETPDDMVFYVTVHGHPLPHVPPQDVPFTHPYHANNLRWAKDDTFWLAYLCVHPAYEGVFTSISYRGRHLPLEEITEPRGDGISVTTFKLRRDICQQWEIIAKLLHWLTNALTIKGTLRPLDERDVATSGMWRPRQLTRIYPDRLQAVRTLMTCRMVLVVWMAQVSYLFSMQPDWETTLAPYLPSHIIPDLRNSWMTDPLIPRRGLFIDASRGTQAQWMSALPFMVNYPGMPIWIYYGARPSLHFGHSILQDYLPRQDDVDAARRSPLNLHLYQAHERVPSASGSTDAHPSHCDDRVSNSFAPPPLPNSRQKHGQTPAEFFSEMKAKQSEKMARETEAEKDLRLQREADQASGAPPSWNGPNVFCWEALNYNGSTFWLRVFVSRANACDLWERTKPSMRLYHSVINEWDVWEGLDPAWTPGDFDEDQELSQHNFPNHSDELVEVDVFANGRASCPLPPAESSDAFHRVMEPQQRVHQSRPDVLHDISRSRPLHPDLHREHPSPPGVPNTGLSLLHSHRDREILSEDRGQHRDNLPIFLTKDEVETLVQGRLRDSTHPAPALSIDCITEVFRYRFGLQRDPLHTPPSSAEQTKHENRLGRIWHFHSSENAALMPWRAHVADLTSRLLQEKFLPATLSDLALSAPSGILARASGISARKAVIWTSNSVDNVYIIGGIGPRDFAWTLAIPCATTMSEILRRSWGPDKCAIIKALVQRGIPFRMFLPSLAEDRELDPQVADTNIGPRGGLGWRMPGFVADHGDYMLYEQHCSNFLRRNTHTRTALSLGGIAWRIVRQFLDADVILDGPSGEAPQQLCRAFHGERHLEEVLTDSELDVICGVYKVLNGYFGQKGAQAGWNPASSTTAKDYSWWPKQSTWLASAANLGYWTSANEGWFQNRLAAIRAGEAEPKSAQQWRDMLKFGRPFTNNVIERMEQHSQRYLQELSS